MASLGIWGGFAIWRILTLGRVASAAGCCSSASVGDRKGRSAQRRVPGSVGHGIVCLGLSLSLVAACQKAETRELPAAVKWLSDQYFGDRDEAVLPNLNRPVIDRFATWRAKGGKAPIVANTFVLSHYFPFHPLNGSVRISWPREYPAGASDAILDQQAQDVRELQRQAGQIGVYLHLNAVVDADIPAMAAGAQRRGFRIAYSGPRCLVLRSATSNPELETTHMLVGGAGGRWDLNDLDVEHCMVATLAAAYGMNVPEVMRAPEHFYPHEAGAATCLFLDASTTKDAVEESNGTACLSRARGAWPFFLLRQAAAQGRLKGGVIRRADFEAAILATANAIGDQTRVRMEAAEAAMIESARSSKGGAGRGLTPQVHR